jgi:single-strand DNA-binding protein
VSFGKTAEFVRNYVKKGALVGIDGRLQQNNFTRKDGTKSYSVDVIAESVQSLESRGARNASGETVEYTQTVENEKSNEPLDIQEDDLPF